MTNKFIYENGKLLEKFNYILPDDPYNDYIGHLFEYDTKVYEIVTNPSGKILNENDTASIVSNDIKEIYNHIDYLNSKPLNIMDVTQNKESFEGDVVIENGRIYYNGIEIIPNDEEDYIDDTPNEYNVFEENTNMNSYETPTINYTDNRFF